MVVATSDRLNPDDEGRPLPVIVRVYQLKNISSMENAEFEAIWLKDKDTLGEDMLDRQDVQTYANRRFTQRFKRKKEANYVVAVAIVRHPTGSSWRTIYELPPSPGEEQCAALQADPSSPPPKAADPRYYFFVEDYRIQAGVDPEAPPEPPPSNSADGGAGGPNAPNAPQQPQAPQSPQAPGQPSMPSTGTPSAPTGGFGGF